MIELGASWVVGDSGASILPGYSAVFAKRHIVEPFEMTSRERGDWWSDCMLVAQATHEIFRPRKLNYEIHGNTIEHLHLHVFPRFDGDAFEGRPIDPREPKRHITTPEQIEALRNAIGRLRASV